MINGALTVTVYGAVIVIAAAVNDTVAVGDAVDTDSDVVVVALADTAAAVG